MAQQLTDNFSIIVGVSKCGTSSLFQYLRDHPEICSAVDKDVGFFYDQNIAQHSRYKTIWTGKFHSNGLSTYLNAFPPRKNRRYYLEASTVYFYSSDTARRIHDCLPCVKLLFIFRNPVERFTSVYKFHQQIHYIFNDMTLKQYINIQQDSVVNAPTRTLITGRYAHFLREYWETFPHDDILLLNFAQLKQSPRDLMRRICRFLDIDPTFYDNYIFDIVNPTRTHRSLAFDRVQRSLIMPIRRQLQRFPRLFNIVSTVNHRTWLPLYELLNSKPIDKNEIHPEDMEFLQNYYKDEARLLYELTGVDGLIGS